MGQLHIVLLPFIAHGHTIPMLDMAKLFVAKGLKTTIISTPAFSGPIIKAQELGHDIGLAITKFPSEGSSLPHHLVSMDQSIDGPDDLFPKFLEALSLMQKPVETLVEELNPNCLVSDMFLPWTVDSAAKFGIPRLVFHGTSYFSLCASYHMKLHKPFKNVSSDSEPFVLPCLPQEFEFVRSQVSPSIREEKGDAFSKLLRRVTESEAKSYGVVVNSFYELESDYAEHYTKFLRRKAWQIGPLLLNNNGNQEKAHRGKKPAIDENECLQWLNSKRPNSVVYVSFGSMANFTHVQLHELAVGLEGSGQDFIWVVRKGNIEDWQPEGFEERMKGKGLIIKGWAPQVVILDHSAIGAFVTHCGWNSTLEGICVGVPMVTWPVFAEQFFNEKLVTEVLRTGVSVGNKKWKRRASEGVGRDAVTKAVHRVIMGDEAIEMRSRAQYYKEMARKAIEDGGSSYNSLNDLIAELSVHSPLKKKDAN